MPKGLDFAAAADEVDDWLQAFQNVRQLSSAEIASFPGRQIRCGWLLDFSGDPEVQSEVRVLLPELFPYTKPLIAVSADRFLIWPHVEEDGVLCALPLTASIDTQQPLGVTRAVLGEALKVIKLGLSGDPSDFRDEFYSYWNRARTKGKRSLVSLLKQFSGPSLVSAYFGPGDIIVGDDDTSVRSWIARREGRKQNLRLDQMLLLNLHEALIPSQYPRHSSDLQKIADLLDGASLNALYSQLRSKDALKTVLLEAPTANGRSLAAINIGVPAAVNRNGHDIDKPQNGFRPRHTVPKIWLNRFFSEAPNPQRLKVNRADGPWVHGRVIDKSMNLLAERRVLLIGVGSVGSFVAELLAASGVGNLYLVDPEDLAFANASRHLLGVDSEGKNKAKAVADLLQRRFPHHLVTGADEEGQAFVRKAMAKGDTYDLVLSLAGDWELDSFLNAQFLAGHQALFQLLFGWAEPHAVAGHAVLLRDRRSCLRCHFSGNGKPDVAVAQWSGETMLTEPACGGQFQPYGIVDVMSINAMIASLAIDALLANDLDNTHRIYASPDARIEQNTGAVTPVWRRLRNDLSGNEAVVLTREWTSTAMCDHTGVDDAA